jgi:hypothetical protein
MMQETLRRDWNAYCSKFSEQNAGRKTRLGVFERKGNVLHDYWLEDGLPLRTVYVESTPHRTSLFISVGEMNHEVLNVKD